MDKEKMAKNLAKVQSDIAPYSTKMVAVTKFVDAKTTRDLYDLGVREMGENRSDKFLAKLEALEDIQSDITWHFIGHLQSRQVKLIINQVDYLHSLDRLSLAKEIQKRAEHPVKCFLQVNVSGEETKGGFDPDRVMEAVEAIEVYDKVQIVGLMTMAPIDAGETELHSYFSELKELQEKVASKNYAWAPCKDISMGMSRDYHVALEEGASYIRVGSALFDPK
ncbi:YggS family pyridoxal phosphate-dependent enzyme [Facklamia sp. 7083-14-GEN3]|uniref:YggS family pyridoxal phosphate-dependent enzyme n=1 Tax=Facklamia sp. 7083-14-GEN3 TaxID=2973478 RepID=UPI00215B93C0|nr:YggS family pyridoxal phosphate-dependent enzyme [Facklamia sp. 7083-14-GEN3]MCR8968617.1 YggS family pyridoxal phosphate-dependent enzyme [Facklamia sp. 7083-14-GEN3]